MSHKGNFNVTEMGRIALSLQELVELQQKEIEALKCDRRTIQNQLNHTLKVVEAMRAKRDRLQEIIKHDLEIMEKQSQVMDDYKKLLDEMNWWKVIRKIFSFKR